MTTTLTNAERMKANGFTVKTEDLEFIMPTDDDEYLVWVGGDMEMTDFGVALFYHDKPTDGLYIVKKDRTVVKVELEVARAIGQFKDFLDYLFEDEDAED